VQYFNVSKDQRHLEEMLRHSKGQRKVPVIVAAGKVTIGFEGGT
jgi:glutaredoxin 3